MTYSVFEGAQRDKPGSGFVVHTFETEDIDDVKVARGLSVWSHEGVDKNGHTVYKFVKEGR